MAICAVVQFAQSKLFISFRYIILYINFAVLTEKDDLC